MDRGHGDARAPAGREAKRGYVPPNIKRTRRETDQIRRIEVLSIWLYDTCQGLWRRRAGGPNVVAVAMGAQMRLFSFFLQGVGDELGQSWPEIRKARTGSELSFDRRRIGYFWTRDTNEHGGRRW